MKDYVDLHGSWDFRADIDKKGLDAGFFRESFNDSITLPNTVSAARKIKANDELAYTGYLTDPRECEGYMWFSRSCEIPSPISGGTAYLLLERTRISTVWIDGECAGTIDSLCSSHRHDITRFIIGKKSFRLTVMVSNTDYPVPGGHMTSPDTQTNWNGILGKIGIEICSDIRLERIRTFPDINERALRVTADIIGADNAEVTVSASGNGQTFPEEKFSLSSENAGFTYVLGEKAALWDEFSHAVYTLHITCGEEKYDIPFGLRKFSAGRNEKTGYFTMNGKRVNLRGKHDGMIFPMTGYAPTDVDSWLKVMKISKEYGINHYRFHTCCPPDAAFTAADMLGIYMQPELPFWGTIADEEDDGQRYLTAEGFRILDEFGSHPSFVMMSMGNELWGSKERLNTILGGYKAYDSTKLYTQGSNNYQFIPCVLENDDFFSGVRFSRDRLFRGSYAMCDAPLGHIQTDAPNSSHCYDDIIHPKTVANGTSEGGTIEIQYGTGVKTVSADSAEEFSTFLPVVSHEIGQYETFPDFSEIEKYTGVLKAKNLEIFRDRLAEKGLSEFADRFFRASGHLAADCWREEIETALRSDGLAGFQLLDIQDFTGQGTALVGILNSFMENKGIISQEKWAGFCSERVLLISMPTFVYTSGGEISADVKLYDYSENGTAGGTLKITAEMNGNTVFDCEKPFDKAVSRELADIGSFSFTAPQCTSACHITITAEYGGVRSERTVTVLPVQGKVTAKNTVITDSADEAKTALSEGKRVLFFPDGLLDDKNSIAGAYCTDFWCYHMFNMISENMGRPTPVGTHGYLIQNSHHALDGFASETYSTPQWFDIAENSRTMILDGLPIDPVVRTIDNFDRNHNLGTIFEVKCGGGKLLVCTAPLLKLESPCAKQLLASLAEYADSDNFNPSSEVGFGTLFSE